MARPRPSWARRVERVALHAGEGTLDIRPLPGERREMGEMENEREREREIARQKERER